MWEELEKDLHVAIKHLDDKIAAVDAFIAKYPYKTTMATHPVEVVQEEERLLVEYQEARDAFFKLFTKIIKASVDEKLAS